MKPFFVVGAERSGTTILGALIGAPEHGLTIPESHFFIESALSDHRAGTFVQNLPEVLHAIKCNPRFQRWGIELSASTEQKLLAQNGLRGFWEILVRSYGESRGRPSPQYWVDHSPMYALHVESLVEIFPNARFIHIVRDPRAVAASLFSLSWGPRTAETFAGYWLQKTGAAFAAQVLFPERFTLVKYEDLARSNKWTLSELSNFLEVTALDPNTTVHFEIPEESKTQHSYLGSGLAPGVSSDWSRHLQTRTVEEIEGYLGGFMDMLAYRRDFPNSRSTLGSQSRRGNLRRFMNLWGRG